MRLTLSLISGQHGVTYPSTLDASRLKIMVQSVDSDSESTSERKKRDCIIWENAIEIWEIWENKFGIFPDFFIFPNEFRKKSVISPNVHNVHISI
jgi:hypothetical protein